MSQQPTLSLDALHAAVSGRAAALRRIVPLQPAGGPGDKVFPPTYEGGKYAVEQRITSDGEISQCVLLDSVQSQANRMELALLDAFRAGQIQLPVLTVTFDDARLRKRFTVTSLEAPHRIADALLRDSLLDGVTFRQSPKGRVLDDADIRNATGLFGLNPTALLFGLWDSTGPRGGMGVKFQRAIVSEIVAQSAQAGVKTSSRIDPAQIMLGAGPVYERAAVDPSTPSWTLEESKARAEKGKPVRLGKDGKPSESNHGNVTPGITDGGYTFKSAQLTTVLSLPVLRRLRFPTQGATSSDVARDTAGRTALAALGVLAATLAAEAGLDLRSRCLLVPQAEPVWDILGAPGQAPASYSLDGDAAIGLFRQALDRALSAGLPWEGEIHLTPTDDLLKLVERSQNLASTGTSDA